MHPSTYQTLGRYSQGTNVTSAWIVPHKTTASMPCRSSPETRIKMLPCSRSFGGWPWYSLDEEVHQRLHTLHRRNYLAHLLLRGK
jgi:hypothetical protein